MSRDGYLPDGVHEADTEPPEDVWGEDYFRCDRCWEICEVEAMRLSVPAWNRGGWRNYCVDCVGDGNE